MTEMGGAESGSEPVGSERDHAPARAAEAGGIGTSEVPGAETGGEPGVGARDAGEIGPAEPVGAGSPPSDAGGEPGAETKDVAPAAAGASEPEQTGPTEQPNAGIAPGTDRADVAEPGEEGPADPREEGPAEARAPGSAQEAMAGPAGDGDSTNTARSDAAADAAAPLAEPGEQGPAESDRNAGRGAEAPDRDQQEPADEADPETAEPGPAQPDSAQPETPEPEPAQPEAAGPEGMRPADAQQPVAQQQEPSQESDPPGDCEPAQDTQPAQEAEPAAETDPAADQTAGRGTEPPEVTRVDVPSTYPSDYVPYSGQPAEVGGPHESPESWINGINPDEDAPGRDNNCAECSRAVEDTWEGKPATAAAMSDQNAAGEPVRRMEDWAGEQPQQASMPQIGQRLNDLGPGSSAIVGCDWVGGGGHWFNAVNDKGTVKAVDGQSGETEAWAPSAAGLGFDESDMRYSDAIFFDANGKVVK
jgi:Papain fold toxin 1, glutamine deamidase